MNTMEDTNIKLKQTQVLIYIANIFGESSLGIKTNTKVNIQKC